MTFTKEYRRNLLREEKLRKLKEAEELEIALSIAQTRCVSYTDVPTEIRQRIDGELEDLQEQHLQSTKARILKKLANLNNGPVLIL